MKASARRYLVDRLRRLVDRLLRRPGALQRREIHDREEGDLLPADLDLRQLHCGSPNAYLEGGRDGAEVAADILRHLEIEFFDDVVVELGRDHQPAGNATVERFAIGRHWAGSNNAENTGWMPITGLPKVIRLPALVL